MATRWKAHRDHDGELAGTASTGKEVTVKGFTFSRLENRKVVEERQVWDALGMLVQLGAATAPAPAGGSLTDTRKGLAAAAVSRARMQGLPPQRDSLVPETGMSTSFAHSSHMPRPECGDRVAAAEQEAHAWTRAPRRLPAL